MNAWFLWSSSCLRMMYTLPNVSLTLVPRTGQIGYALAPAIASGQMFGDDQPVILQLFDISSAAESLQGLRLGGQLSSAALRPDFGGNYSCMEAVSKQWNVVDQTCLLLRVRLWVYVHLDHYWQPHLSDLWHLPPTDARQINVVQFQQHNLHALRQGIATHVGSMLKQMHAR